MEITKWLGLKNSTSPERLKPGALEVARDVDIDGSGAIRTRAGQTAVSATSSHSMWAKDDFCVVMQGTDLKRVGRTGAMTQITRLTYGGPVSFAEQNDVVYFSNGIDTGRLVNGAAREWGIRPPVFQPAAAATGGALPAGRYMYAMTFVRADGLESGTRHAGVITLADTGGISFSLMETSSDTEVVGRCLYVSGASGEELYRVAVLGPLATTYTHYDNRSQGVPLERGYVEAAPAGTIVEIHAGVAYVVDGDTAWYSEQYSFERFRRDERFLRLPGQLQMFASVEAGVFAGTDKAVYYLDGTDPTTMRAAKVADVGVIPGTSVKFDYGLEPEGDAEKPGQNAIAAMWISSAGIMVGLPGGQVQFLTADDYAIPTAQRGGAMLRVARGYASYVASLQGATQPGSSYP